jgi:predicted acylesterase/phospholipase RssA
VGVITALQDSGVLQEGTPMAGASAGSLIVACYHAGLDMNDVKGYMYEMADDCRWAWPCMCTWMLLLSWWMLPAMSRSAAPDGASCCMDRLCLCCC